MDPETKKIQEEMKKLQQKVENLERLLSTLNSSTTIPLEVAAAIQARLNEVFPVGSASATLPATHTQGVSEAGIASYNVAKVMTGFIKITFNGVAYNIPYY